MRYQPVVRLADRRPVMVEALARWSQPPAPAVPPESFVALAERTGLIRALSAAVAARVGAEFPRLGARFRIGVSLNLPLAVLLRPDTPGWLRRVCGAAGLRPRQLVLELTETTPVRDACALRRALLRLRAAGHRVLLDDLGPDDPRERLLALPFAGAKLDRSLVEILPEDARRRHAVRRLVRAAAARGQVVVAEGVSDARLWGTARALGVDHAQGFAVGRPLTAAALPAWWADWRGRPPQA